MALNIPPQILAINTTRNTNSDHTNCQGKAFLIKKKKTNCRGKAYCCRVYFHPRVKKNHEKRPSFCCPFLHLHYSR